MTVAASLALVVVLGVCMTACGGDKPKEETKQPAEQPVGLTMNDYIKRLNDAGYEVQGKPLETQADIAAYLASEEGAEMTAMGIKADDIAWMFYAANEEWDGVNVAKINSEDQAKAIVAATEEQLAAYPEMGMAAARDGNVVMTGNKAAVNAALGKETTGEEEQPEVTETTMEEYIERLDGTCKMDPADTEAKIAAVAEMVSIDAENIEWALQANDFSIMIIKLTTEDAAQSAADALQASADAAGEEAGGAKAVCDGKVVLFGNPTTISIAQGK